MHSKDPNVSTEHYERPHARSGLTLWKGPMRCSPTYDLKLSNTISLMTSRGIPAVVAILRGAQAEVPQLSGAVQKG